MSWNVAELSASFPIQTENRTMDPIAQFKENQKKAWSTFTPTEIYTCQPSARLVAFASRASL